MGTIKSALFALLAITVLYLSFLYVRIWHFLGSYTYGYEIKSFDTDLFQEFAKFKQGKTFFTFDFSVWLKNNSDFKIDVSGLNIAFYHSGKYIGYSSGFPTILIEKNSKTTFDGSAKIYLNNEFFKTMFLAAKQKIRIDYVVKFKLYRLPFSFTYKGFYLVETQK